VSTDTADIIHAAEDELESQRLAARVVVNAWRLVIGNADGSPRQASALAALGSGIQALDVLSEERFVRPGCEEVAGDIAEHGSECIQGEDCGGHHPWTLDD
jgi:hypothetical protein